jgi:hypothetical protein
MIARTRFLQFFLLVLCVLILYYVRLFIYSPNELHALLFFAGLIVQAFLLLSAIIYCLCKHLVGTMKTTFLWPYPTLDCIALIVEGLTEMLIPTIIVLPRIVSLVPSLMPASPLLCSLFGILIIWMKLS